MHFGHSRISVCLWLLFCVVGTASSLELSSRYWDMIREINTETKIPEAMLCRLIAWESHGRADYRGALNANGTRDYGLMALNSAYLDYFAWRFNGGVEINPRDARTNLRVGMRLLAEQFRLTGSWYYAIWAYNSGYSRWQRGIMPRETRYYLSYVFGDFICIADRDYTKPYFRVGT